MDTKLSSLCDSKMAWWPVPLSRNTVPSMSVLGLIELCGKMLWQASVSPSTCLRSRFTPCILYWRGVLCYEVSQISYTTTNLHQQVGMKWKHWFICICLLFHAWCDNDHLLTYFAICNWLLEQCMCNYSCHVPCLLLRTSLAIEKKKKNKKTQVILSALRLLTCNSTRPQHTLQMFSDHYGPKRTILWETINQGLLQPQGELYPIQTIFNHRSRDQLLEFCTSFYETLSSEFLVQGNFKHTQFSQEHWYWWDSNSQPLAPKASTVSIELTWL